MDKVLKYFYKKIKSDILDSWEKIDLSIPKFYVTDPLLKLAIVYVYVGKSSLKKKNQTFPPCILCRNSFSSVTVTLYLTLLLWPTFQKLHYCQ